MLSPDKHDVEAASVASLTGYPLN